MYPCHFFVLRSSTAPSVRSLFKTGDASAISEGAGLLDEGGVVGGSLLSCLPLPQESGYVNEPQ